MQPKKLVTALNAMREAVMENDHLHHQYIPVIERDSDFQAYGAAVNTYTSTQNAFMSQLMNRIVSTAILRKNFNNPLSDLEGEAIPMGYAGQEIYTNPATPTQFNDDDFLGLLQKYEADTKVQYFHVNKENQYNVTVGRNRLEQAFVSYPVFIQFVEDLVDSLYKGLYIDKYDYTKALVAAAYAQNMAQIEVVTPVTDASSAQAFVRGARDNFFKLTVPSSNNNAWAKVGGSGRPIVTWTDPEEIVFLVRSDVRSALDVDVLAVSFNMDKSSLLGKIYTVENFDIVDRKSGTKIFDGSNILGIMCDRRWFRIKDQRIQLDEFYNGKNMTWNYFLQAFMMYQFSLFANALIFATATPTITANSLTFSPAAISVPQGGTSIVNLQSDPITATSERTITVTGTGVTLNRMGDTSMYQVNATEEATTGSRTATAKQDSATATLAITVTTATPVDTQSVNEDNANVMSDLTPKIETNSNKTSK